MAIISNGIETGNLLDGEILKYGKKEDYEKHVPCFIDFCEEYYPEVAIFKRLTIRHTPEVFAYFLQDLGNIIFLNTTSDTSIKKYGKTGMIVLPKDPTENQQESLLTFAREIDDYRISIFYNLELVEGIVGGSELHTSSEENKPIDMIQKGFSFIDGKSK